LYFNILTHWASTCAGEQEMTIRNTLKICGIIFVGRPEQSSENRLQWLRTETAMMLD